MTVSILLNGLFHVFSSFSFRADLSKWQGAYHVCDTVITQKFSRLLAVSEIELTGPVVLPEMS